MPDFIEKFLVSLFTKLIDFGFGFLNKRLNEPKDLFETLKVIASKGNKHFTTHHVDMLEKLDGYMTMKSIFKDKYCDKMTTYDYMKFLSNVIKISEEDEYERYIDSCVSEVSVTTKQEIEAAETFNLSLFKMAIDNAVKDVVSDFKKTKVVDMACGRISGLKEDDYIDEKNAFEASLRESILFHYDRLKFDAAVTGSSTKPNGKRIINISISGNVVAAQRSTVFKKIVSALTKTFNQNAKVIFLNSAMHVQMAGTNEMVLPNELDGSEIVFDTSKLGMIYSAIGNVIKNMNSLLKMYYKDTSIKVLCSPKQFNEMTDQFIGVEDIKVIQDQRG